MDAWNSAVSAFVQDEARLISGSSRGEEIGDSAGVLVPVISRSLVIFNRLRLVERRVVPECAIRASNGVYRIAYSGEVSPKTECAPGTYPGF